VAAADSYIRRKLRSGIPSLYSDLLPLYKNPDKVALLSQLLESMVASLEAKNEFAASEEEPSPKVESPMVIMWMWKLLANHYERTGEPLKAIEFVNKAITHTPSCVELYLCKGRIYKHHGNTKAAAECLEKARTMDLADRYLNTRSTVYLLRNGEMEKAEKTVVLFTKEGDQVSNLNEMQCMWWAIECGKAYMKKKQYGQALKKLTSVEKYFTDFNEDQFDFHSYCLRKMTLRSYYAMLMNSEKIRNNKNFLKAAEAVVKCYLAIHESPQAANDDEYAGMDEKEKKKAKAKKAKADARKKEEEKKAATAGKKGDKKPEAKAEKKKKDEDDDPNGSKLLQKNPLEECLRYVDLLQKYQPLSLLTHCLAYDVYSKMERPLGMVKALRNAAKIDKNAAELHPRLCDFYGRLGSGALKLSAIGKVVVDELSTDTELLGKQTIQDINKAYVAANTTDAPRRAAGAMGMVSLGAKPAAVVGTLSDLSGDGVTVAHAYEVMAMLEGLDKAGAAKFKEACAGKFPLSTEFNPKLLDEEQLFAPEMFYRDREIEG